MGVVVRRFRADDRAGAQSALLNSDAFSPEEVAVAVAMIDEGLAGRYELLLVERARAFAGYSCFGRAALTQSAWYLYWICVAAEARGAGFGLTLEAATTRRIAELGGSRIVVETSGRADYAGARQFYTRAGYTEAGRLPDFYAAGDDCVIYFKSLRPEEAK